MSKVDRFDCEEVNVGFAMVKCDGGDWVRIDDYEALDYEFQQMRDSYDKLVSKIEDIWREA